MVITKKKNQKDDKILMVCPDANEYWAREIAKQNKNVEIHTLYKSCNKIFRLIRRISVKWNISIRPFLGSWYKRMNEYDSIIIDANAINSTLPQWLRKNKYSGRIIYWYWNPVISCVNPMKIRRDLCELWSFDPIDCVKYDMHFNSQYYFPTIHLKKEEKIEYDVFFIGREKGRLVYLTELEKIMKSKGLNTYFHIVNEAKIINQQYPYKPLLPYETVLEYIGSSKVVLDIVQEGQSGQTLRSLEALFFSKKLITNNRSIIDCDFYCKDNIFILDIDDFTKIKEFVDSPFQTIEKSIIKKYEFNEWIKGF